MPRAQYRNWYVTEAASLRIGGVHTRDRVQPSAGARCGKAARRDLRGGAGVTRSPTATLAARIGAWIMPGLRHVKNAAVPGARPSMIGRTRHNPEGGMNVFMPHEA
jgi:hypothetical protein